MGQDQSALTRDTERDNPYHSDKADIYGVLCSETPCNCIQLMLRTLFNRKTIKLRIVLSIKPVYTIPYESNKPYERDNPYHSDNSVREQQTVYERDNPYHSDNQVILMLKPFFYGQNLSKT